MRWLALVVLLAPLPALAQEACVFRPPRGEFSPVEACRWTAPEDHPRSGRRDVVMAPVLANLTDDDGDGDTDLDDIPELVFTTYNLDGGCCNQNGTIRVVSGRCNDDGTMDTLATLDDWNVDNSGGLALGDLNGDGVPEIVAMLISGGQPQGTLALTRTAADGSAWEALWRNAEIPRWNRHSRGGAQPSLADVNGDGTPDVVVGNAVIDGRDGSTLWDGRQTVGAQAGIGNNAFLGPISTVGDVDLDGAPEVMAGNTLYAADGSERWTFDFPSSNSRCGGDLSCDGYNALGNFDDDDEGEVVIIRRGEVYILEHDGAFKWSAQLPVDNCGFNEAGPPTVADFDGDGRAEIGTAAADFYVVADPDCSGDPLPRRCDSPGILWKVRNDDCSSRVTASSVFDFEADGEAEVVYADEVVLRIYRGRDGVVLWEDEAHGSHTRLEQPVVADVDNDGNAEVVIVGNGSRGGIPGVRVFEDAADNWVRTRRIWNQHGYHVTNVDETGAVPRVEPPNWLQEGLNNFRQNVQGDGVFDAPDLVVELSADRDDCPERMVLLITVRNQGALDVPRGLAVSLYEGLLGDPRPARLDTFRLPAPLRAGEAFVIEAEYEIPPGREADAFDFYARADDVGDGEGGLIRGEHNECREDNNTVALEDIVCEDLCPPGIDGPMPEVCNGVDDDCDGAVDEAPPPDDRCASGEPGRCGPGHFVCINGALACLPDLQPGAETCDATDEDCDGRVDEGLRSACGTCDAPPPESCDGVDEDCDGVVDEDAPCPPGLECAEGQCVEPCPNNECVEAGRVCVRGFCFLVCDVCPEGLDCDDRGQCVDLCAEVVCGAGERCLLGACVADDCREGGCREGALCIEGECRPDPCAAAECAAEEVCRQGACVPSCAPVACAADERCVDGGCFGDPCFDLVCPDGQLCYRVGEGAECAAPDCLQCLDGQRCVRGECVDDPCVGVRCPVGQICEVDRGEANCVFEDVAPPPPPDGGVGPDAGAERDAGFDAAADLGVDARAPPEDDAARPALDAEPTGAEPTREPAEPVAGGCSCATGRAPAALWLLLLLGWRPRRR